MKSTKCLYCKISFEYRPSQSTGKYCSNQCQQWMIVQKKMNSGDCVYGHGIRKWCYSNLEQKCCECGVGNVWNDKPLRLQVDHKDGNVRNNRKNNLRMICPNCHTQTENWGVKNASNEGKNKMFEAARNTHQKRFGVVA